MRVAFFVILLIALLPLSSAIACEFPRLSIEDWVKSSDEIFIGKITLVSAPKYGTKGTSIEAIQEARIYGLDLIVWADSIENIVGIRENLVAHINSCSGGSTAQIIPDTTAIFFSRGGIWHAKEYNSEVVAQIRSLTSQSNSQPTTAGTAQSAAPN